MASNYTNWRANPANVEKDRERARRLREKRKAAKQTDQPAATLRSTWYTELLVAASNKLRYRG